MQVADRQVQTLGDGSDTHLALQYRVGVVELEDFSVDTECYLDPQPEALCEYRRAVALLEFGDREAAFQAIEASLELNDGFCEAHVLKGQLSLEQGYPG